ncbi:hypothetical protein YC2023_124269 [Brassica napus]
MSECKILQARGLKKHLKRLNAPKHWDLDKLGGAFAPKPSSGPHKSRECLPLVLIIRNKLKYALTYREVISILMQRHIQVDGKVRTDKTYPAGFMDVVSIPKTNENFRHEFATRLGNVFTLGKGTKPWVSLPKGKGIKLTIIEEARKRLSAQQAA